MGLIKTITESFKVFKTKDVEQSSYNETKKKHGEAIGDVHLASSYGSQNLSSFNLFHNQYIDNTFNTRLDRLTTYRQMASNTEIADVLEDCVNESTEVNDDGHVCWLDIKDENLIKNKNAVDTINEEFKKVFYKRMNINDLSDEFLRTFYIDGCSYSEVVVDQNKKSDGVQYLKKIPTETMDFRWDPFSGKTLFFMQKLKGVQKDPHTFEEAEQDPNIIALYPDQIMYFDYGVYDTKRSNVVGYLEKAKQPYNQLKLLETSAIIYRIVRAPERFVFRIDVGNMPRDKAMKYIAKVKQGMEKKITYDSNSGQMVNSPDILSILENFFIPTSATGRGSDISTIGGNSNAFTELDDIYYFARKLYRSLKYPASRVTSAEEKQTGDNLFTNGAYGEISRDEVKWGLFLLKNQQKYARALRDVFYTHLKLTGLKKEYDLSKDSFSIKFNIPNDILERMKFIKKDQKVRSYQDLVNNDEFSKYYLMKNVLGMSEDEIKENVEGLKKDKELFGSGEEDMGFR